MKKIFLLVSLVALIVISNNSFAQKSFEGTIVYGVEYEDLPEEMEAMKSMLPSETTIKIKGSKTRTEQTMGMGSTVAIHDRKENSAIALMNIMGNKIAIKNDLEDQKENEVVSINYIDETKEIAGYKCKKAEITIKGEEGVVVIYYTEDINTQEAKSQYKGLKGFPMQYQINTNEMSMVMTVKEVKEENVLDVEFTVPAEYEEMTMEEFQTKMSGSMMDE